MIKFLINIFIVSFILLNINNTYASSEEEINTFKEKFTDTRQIIGCWNNNLETKQPTKQWNCFRWKGRHNINLPPISHLEIYLKVFSNNLNRIVNSFPTENMESGFNPEAQNAHAIWYVQTLRKYKIWLSIEDQLNWKITRQNRQKSSYKLCWSYKTEDDTIRCLYRAHYHFYEGYYYADKSMIVRAYYKKYFWFN